MPGVWVVTTLALLGANAAFVRSKTSNAADAHCLWWGSPQITYRQSFVGSPVTTGETEFVAVQRAFQAWQAAATECGSLQLTEGPRITDRRIGRSTAGDANVVLFRNSACSKKVKSDDPCWASGSCGNTYDCWDHGAGVLGLTTLTYDAQAGRITDADIELNAAERYFTTVDTPVCVLTQSQSCVADDVQNTVTHEVGHLLGLDHTDRPGSTMNAIAASGETGKRKVDTGTREFICQVYPKGGAPRDCVTDTVPELLGEAAEASRGCSAVGGSTWLALGALALLRRRRA